MLERSLPMTDIKVSRVYYVKLGNKADNWADRCIDEGLLPCGYDLEGTDDRQANAFKDFDENTVWITRHNRCLYWGKAKSYRNPDKPLGDSKNPLKVISCREIKWSNQPDPETGDIFKWEQISGAITKTAMYRQTICNIAHTEYIKTLINGNYRRDKEILWKDCLGAVKTLAPTYFEVFVATIYILLDYYLLEPIGGSSQKNTDLVLQSSDMKKRLLIQIKTSTKQKDFDNYAEIFETELQEGEEAYFIYHKPEKGTIKQGNKRLKPRHINDLLNEVEEENRDVLLKWLKLKCYFGTLESA